VLVAVSLFVVIGIAVDDVFVWVDLWRQQDRSVSLEDRMIQTLGESDEWAVAVAVYDVRLCPHCSYQALCPLAVAITTHGSVLVPSAMPTGCCYYDARHLSSLLVPSAMPTGCCCYDTRHLSSLLVPSAMPTGCCCYDARHLSSLLVPIASCPLMYATRALFTTHFESHSEHLLLGETREQHQVVDGWCCPQRHCPH
jgi:hypothetical protein